MILFSCCQGTKPVIHLCSQTADDNDDKNKPLLKFLQPIVLKTCALCLNVLNEHASLQHAKLLSLTLQHYATKELLLLLGADVECKGNSDSSLANLLDYILPIIVRCQTEKDELVENLVEVMLIVAHECQAHLDKILTENVAVNKVCLIDIGMPLMF